MMKTLSVGANGPEVFVLQTRLNCKPPTILAPLSVDGVFGPKTLARVKEFQKNNGLKMDGIVGPMTWGKLLAGVVNPTTAGMYCDDWNPGNKGVDTSFQAAFQQANTPTATFHKASFLPIGGPSGFSLPSLPSLPSAPTLRSLTAAEITTATGVYGSSIDFSTVSISDVAGAGGRAFVVGIPNPFGRARQVMNVGKKPLSRNTLIHELAHVWQSQHHSDPTKFMQNAVASQAAAEVANLAMGVKSFSAYGYVPGKPFGDYGAEQIAQQVMRGEAAIVSHVASVTAWAVDPDNVTSLKTARIEDTSLPGVKT